jgi:cation transport ATPase
MPPEKAKRASREAAKSPDSRQLRGRRETSDGASTLSVAVRELDCVGCARRIERRLVSTAGVHTVAADVRRRRVDLTFDPAELDTETIVARIRSAGFETRLARAAFPLRGTALSAPGAESVEQEILGIPGVRSAGVDLFAGAAVVDYLPSATTVDVIRTRIGAAGYGADPPVSSLPDPRREGREEKFGLRGIGAAAAALAALPLSLAVPQEGGAFAALSDAALRAFPSIASIPPGVAQIALLLLLVPLGWAVLPIAKHGAVALKERTVNGNLSTLLALVILAIAALAASIAALAGRPVVSLRYAHLSLAAAASVALAARFFDALMRQRITDINRRSDWLEQPPRMSEDLPLTRRRAQPAEAIIAGAVLLAGVLFITLLFVRGEEAIPVAVASCAAMLLAAAPRAWGLASDQVARSAVAGARIIGAELRDASVLRRLEPVRQLVVTRAATTAGDTAEVSHFVLVGGASQAELLAVAAALSRAVEHPVARAIVRRAEPAGEARSASEVVREAGFGVRGIVDGEQAAIGPIDWIARLGVSTANLEEEAEAFARRGKTPVVVARDHELLGMLVLGWDYAPEWRRAAERLRDEEVSLALISGDHPDTVIARAESIGATVLHEPGARAKRAAIARAGGQQPTALLLRDREAEVMTENTVSIVVRDRGKSLPPGGEIVVDSADPLTIAELLRLARSAAAAEQRRRAWALLYHGAAATLIVAVPLVAGVSVEPALAAAVSAIASLRALKSRPPRRLGATS